MVGIDPVKSFRTLSERYLSYYDTPFGVADDTIMRERRELLDRDGGLYREPRIELRPSYALAERPFEQAAESAGLTSVEAEFLSGALLPPGARPYTHQSNALTAEPNRNLVLTPGTGAGKTESFLLPVFAHQG